MLAFELPPELADADTIGVIYDEIDGLNFYNEYGMLRDLFADPALASDKRYADVLRGYLRAETIGPLPFLAATTGVVAGQTLEAEVFCVTLIHSRPTAKSDGQPSVPASNPVTGDYPEVAVKRSADCMGRRRFRCSPAYIR